MWLLDKMPCKLITKDELIVIDHDGREYRYGALEDAPEWHLSRAAA